MGRRPPCNKQHRPAQARSGAMLSSVRPASRGTTKPRGASPSFGSVCACLSPQPCRSPGRSRPSRAGSPSPDSRPSGAGLRLACCLQRWPAASATGGGLPVAWGNTGGGRGGAGGGATGKVALYFLSSDGAGNSQVLQYSPLRAEGHSPFALAMRSCRAEHTACEAVRMHSRASCYSLARLNHGRPALAAR